VEVTGRLSMCTSEIASLIRREERNACAVALDLRIPPEPSQKEIEGTGDLHMVGYTSGERQQRPIQEFPDGDT
jgi:hypothetical protein